MRMPKDAVGVPSNPSMSNRVDAARALDRIRVEDARKSANGDGCVGF